MTAGYRYNGADATAQPVICHRYRLLGCKGCHAPR